MDIHSDYADINGTQIYYEEAGQGPHLVMLHAGIADLRMWDDQFPVFAERYHVVRYDLRGYGKSAAARTEEDFSNREDLRALLDQLEIYQTALMGCSNGGRTVMDFAVEHPERVTALIPVASGLGGFPFEGEPPAYWEEMEAALEQGNLDQATEYALRIWVDSPQRVPEQVAPEMRSKAAEMCRRSLVVPNEPEHRRLAPPAAERLETLKVPALVIVGSLDDANILRIADLIASVLPDARKVILNNTAHLPNMERPTEFNQLVLSFLDAVFHS